MTEIPTTEECIKIMDEFKLPENVREHSRTVNRVAMEIGIALKQAGIKLDLDLVNAGSLLHDLDKIPTLNDIKNHGKLSKKWLSEKQYSKVGEIAENHGIPDDNLAWESKIVSYADKRVQFNKVVSIKQRYEFIRKKYTTFKQEHEDFAYRLEKEIFDKLDIQPEDIK
ncbi:HD domain-containing protein [Candidatus Woesearchaeota archaeon]|nr:HD domain-containing protein [Candidatus Woesearchaeota archaeon]